MQNLTNSEFKRWYIEAVRSDLILNHGLLPKEADKVIAAYRLQYLVEKYGMTQMHEDPRDVTMQMKAQGLYSSRGLTFTPNAETRAAFREGDSALETGDIEIFGSTDELWKDLDI